jgi:hypothetical protein
MARGRAVLAACDAALDSVKEATSAQVRALNLQREQEAAVRQYQQAQQQLEVLKSQIPPQPSMADMELAEKTCASAQAYLGALDQAKGAGGQFAAATAQAHKMAEAATRMDALREACDTTVEMLVEKGVAAFIQRTQKYLPAGDRWRFHMTSSPFAVGFLRPSTIPGDPDVLHTALSGAEWAAMFVAIGCAVAEVAPKDVPIVLLPEERMWDGDTLADVMRALTASGTTCQIVLTSTVPPAGRQPKGWTVIKTGKAPASTSATQEPTNGDA